MLALERLLAADVVLRFSSRLGSWLGDFDEVGIAPGGSPEHRGSTEQLDRKMAIMCYLSVFGWLVAYRASRHERGPLATFHLRQMTLLLLLSVGILGAQIVVLPFFGWSSLVVAGGGLALTLLMRMLGVMAAMSGLQEPLPFIGRFAYRLLPGF